MDHKTWCKCRKCEESREVRNRGKVKRWLPKHVIEMIEQNNIKKSEEMMLRGMMLIVCPSCRHRTWMKVGPVMVCHCCCKKF
jgi:hypothetical protein